MTNHDLERFPPVPNEQTVVWRFMDFTKFVSMLDTGSIFFCRSDKLGDPFEGATPQPEFEIQKGEFLTRETARWKLGHQEMKGLLDAFSRGKKNLREWIFINSWYMSEYESAAMWKIYARTNEAVAVRSTFKHLFDCLPKELPNLVWGKVQYIDFKKESSLRGETFRDRFFYKRKSYEHEREIRAVLLRFPGEVHGYPSHLITTLSDGVYVKTQVDLLIDEIYVAPGSPNWFLELVKNITEKYGLDKPVYRTSLDDEALF